jgi:DNA-binding NtrC family response regulator
MEVDFRVIAATNRDLAKAIKEGAFREDLFYRLNVISFEMPSLKQRKEDVPLLAEHFLNRFSKETNKPIDRISRTAMDEMMFYDWPGNVRELENAIERSVVVGKEREILAENLPIFCHEPIRAPRATSLEEVELAHIQQILTENEWNIARSAKILKIDRSTLYSKIKRFNIRKD